MSRATSEVLVTLDGEERTLCCDLGTWAAVEPRGYVFLDLTKKLSAGTLSWLEFQVMLWAMLRRDPAKPTLETVGDWVTGHNVVTVMAQVALCLRNAFPDMDTERAGPPQKAGDGTGTVPSPSPLALASPLSNSGD